MRVGVLLSGGKDSVLALHRVAPQHEIACCLTVETLNTASYMFHTPNIGLAVLQAQSMGIPLLRGASAGEKEAELRDLQALLARAKAEYGIKGLVTGALASDYQRERVEKLCAKSEMTCMSPLWHMDPRDELRELIANGYKIIFVRVAAEGLDKSWLGEALDTEHLQALITLHERYGVHIGGEGGEYETLVLDAPLFKQRIEIISAHVEPEEGAHVLVVTEAALRPKPIKQA